MLRSISWCAASSSRALDPLEKSLTLVFKVNAVKNRLG